MPLLKFKTKEEIPEEHADSAFKLEDGSFGVVEDPDTSELQQALDDERKKREAAEKNAATAARKLKGLENKKKAEDSGIDEETRQQIRDEARQEVLDEQKDEIESGRAAATENRQLKMSTLLSTTALSKLAGIRKDRFEPFNRLYADHFDLTADGKGLVVKGKPGVDPAKHIAWLKTQPGAPVEFWEGSKADGGGALSANGGPSGSGSISFDDLMKSPGKGLALANEAGAK